MKRYIALDVLRGLTVALMIMVNNPGAWDMIFPPLKHAAWDGCTPCDLVFPFFLFCVGVSMAFSLAKYTSVTKEASAKILKRGLLLYLTGLLLTAFPFYPVHMNPGMTFWQNYSHWLDNLRLTGILSRIAMCYVLASFIVLWLRSGKKIMGAVGVRCALHVGLLLLFAGPEGEFSLEGNFGRAFDNAIFGESHVYHGYTNAAGQVVPFDPEGIFGTLTGTCTVLLGFLIGGLIRSSEGRQYELVSKIYTCAAVSLAVSMILIIWIPINKSLWSASYVFHAGGWAMLVLAFLIYLIDIKGVEKPFFPFKALGMNALTLFVLSGLLMKINWIYIGWNYSAVFGGSAFMSLLFSLMYLLLHLVIAVVLYRKKIFIKL